MSDMSFPTTTPLRCGEASPGQRSFHFMGYVQPADWWTTPGNVVNVTWRLSLYLEHVRQRGAWRYSAVWYTHLSRKVLYEIKGSHDVLQCLP